MVLKNSLCPKVFESILRRKESQLDSICGCERDEGSLAGYNTNQDFIS